jgi:hypothetical protein
VAVTPENKEIWRFISGDRNFLSLWADIGYSRKTVDGVIIGITDSNYKRFSYKLGRCHRSETYENLHEESEEGQTIRF